ncbi:esterase-like activity of phytase family protein [Paracoccus aminophilus]|uniref:Phytase-like domain-containing protein n=1 Tax=Paracoccus aminophilus JCM 7686 TaxID=1367847 RepID=S5YVG0_PARAH|nr:esterase-like activity of phytase family protein [Paracoccus aminophilus]AGT09206.1 hypothetical protein JCM7686_2125 [Paracoccus aminophilus JCM 7686]
MPRHYPGHPPHHGGHDPHEPAVNVSNVNFLGSLTLGTGIDVFGTTLGGLSGLYYNPLSGAFAAISDDVSDPRAHGLLIDLSDGSLDPGDIRIAGVAQILTPDGGQFETTGAELEAIAFNGNTVYLASSGDAAGNPAIYVMEAHGLTVTQTGELPIDDKFLHSEDGRSGVQVGHGFESIALSPDRETLWTATERALIQDMGAGGRRGGEIARIVQYDLRSGTETGEFAYQLDRAARMPRHSEGSSSVGLVEMLALDDHGTLLALERGVINGPRGLEYTAKLYLVDLSHATDVSDRDSLSGSRFQTAEKTLLANLDDFHIDLANLEGMALGQKVPVTQADGSVLEQQSLIIISDDDFGATGAQGTQIIALGLTIDDSGAHQRVNVAQQSSYDHSSDHFDFGHNTSGSYDNALIF